MPLHLDQKVSLKWVGERLLAYCSELSIDVAQYHCRLMSKCCDHTSDSRDFRRFHGVRRLLPAFTEGSTTLGEVLLFDCVPGPAAIGQHGDSASLPERLNFERDAAASQGQAVCSYHLTICDQYLNNGGGAWSHWRLPYDYRTRSASQSRNLDNLQQRLTSFSSWGFHAILTFS